MGVVVDSWGDAGDETAAAAYQLRFQLFKAGIGHKDFEDFSYDVIEPIIGNDRLSDADKATRLKRIGETLPR
jgi:hypothetical protein